MSSSDDIKDIKEEIADILGIENNDYWEIISSQPDHDLYMVHYTANADKKVYGHLRGTVIDVLAKTIVCQSFGFTPVVNQAELSIDPRGDLDLTDIYGTRYQMPIDQVVIKQGFEGTVLRIFKHDGIVYHSTHHRLDGSRSRWGDSPTFLQMYQELNGPTNEELFNPDSCYSPYCYVFLMVHPALLLSSKQNVGPGYLVYLGSREMYSTDPELGPYRQSLETSLIDIHDERPDAGYIDPELRDPAISQEMQSRVYDEMPSQIESPFIFRPNDLSLDEANHFIRYGFYDSFDDIQLDSRLGIGEFVMIYYYDEDGNLLQLLKVQGPAYQWRTEMRDNNPNLYQQLYLLLNGSYIEAQNPDFRRQYAQLYPLLTPYSVEATQRLIRRGPILIWPQDLSIDPAEIPLNEWEQRFRNIWQSYLVSVPLHRQEEVFRLYQSFFQDRDLVITWLITLNEEDDLLSSNESISRRARQIITQARCLARDRTMVREGYGSDGRKGNGSIFTMTEDNIRILILKEEGASLYRLVKEASLAFKSNEAAQDCSRVTSQIQSSIGRSGGK